MGTTHYGRRANYGGWEIVGQLGSGGQSEVYRVRTPQRAIERANISKNLQALWDGVQLETLASAMYNFGRPDEPGELAALKIFKIPDGGPERDLAKGRLANEISVLSHNLPGMLKLLDSNKDENWIVTELMHAGTLEEHPQILKGDAFRTLKAIRPIVHSLSILHAEGKVHRDIKPANVFITDDGLLALGDFGIVYVPDSHERLTATDERVGPRDYMPQWANLGLRHETVEPNFDVYMLGKLLWCAVAGRLKLPREWHTKPSFNLVSLFPNDDTMPLVNEILDKCLVEDPEECLSSASELLELIDGKIALVESGGQIHTTPRRCRICGKGHYEGDGSRTSLQRLDPQGRPLGSVPAELSICTYCSHFEFFAPGYPEKAKRLEEEMKRQMKK